MLIQTLETMSEPLSTVLSETPSTTPKVNVKKEIGLSNLASVPLKPIVRGYGKKGSEVSPIIVERETPDVNRFQKLSLLKTTGPSLCRRKRRLVIDNMRAIPNGEFKKQLQDTSDIVGAADLAPPTKKAMHQLAYGGVGKFFAYPGRKIPSGSLAQIFFSHLTVRAQVHPPPRSELEPLDPELKTPTTYLQPIPCFTPYDDYHSVPSFSETLAKRTAISFDQIVKGFTSSKRKKSQIIKEYKRKNTQIKLEQELARVECMNNMKEECMKQDIYTPTESPNPGDSITEELIISDTLEPPDTSDLLVEKNNEDFSEKEHELIFLNVSSGSDEAETYDHDPELGVLSPRMTNAEIGELELTCEEVECVAEEKGSEEKQIVFYTPDPTDDTYVFVDETGKRYTVSSLSSGLTSWSQQSTKAVD